MALNRKPYPNRSYLIRAGLPVVLIILIKIISLNAHLVEYYYSTRFYAISSALQRGLTGWVPFSLGDILYIFLVVLIILGILRGFKNIRTKRSRFIREFPVKRYLVIVLWIYIIFNLIWGINYNRQGIASQIGLQVKPYTLVDLKQIQGLLLDSVNRSKEAFELQKEPYPTNKQLFARAIACYHSSSKVYPYLKYRPASVKSSMFGEIGNYLGFSGYYNPFSGEAQVNTTIPKFLLPYTTCHEMGHQLGYAKEMEANFVGFLTATGSGDNLFRYSAYLDLYVYATREVAIYDSVYAKKSYLSLLPSVKTDLKEVRDFWRRHQNPVEPVITWLYGNYLKANQQPRGMQAYNEVTADLIAFYKKYKRI